MSRSIADPRDDVGGRRQDGRDVRRHDAHRDGHRARREERAAHPVGCPRPHQAGDRHRRQAPAASATTRTAVRSPGTTLVFQMPPSDSALGSSPSADSPTAWKAAKPDPSVRSTSSPRVRAGSAHGRFATSAEPARARTARGRGAARTTTAATRTAVTPLDGLQTALSASRTKTPPQRAGSSRSRQAASTTHGRSAYPATVAHCPMESRSTTHGFHRKNGGRRRHAPGRGGDDALSASRPMPTPATTKDARRIAFCSHSPGTTGWRGTRARPSAPPAARCRRGRAMRPSTAGGARRPCPRAAPSPATGALGPAPGRRRPG